MVTPKAREGTPLHVRLSDEERERIDGAAQAEGLPVSQWVRRTLMRAAGKVKR